MGGGPGDHHPAGLEQGAELLGGPGSRASSAAARRPATPAGSSRRSTRASTATGRPSTTMRGLRSTEAMPGSASTAAERPRRTSARASRSTAGSPRNSPSRAWVARSSIISSASARLSGHQPHHHVGDAPRRGCRRRPAARWARTAGRGTTPAISSRVPLHHGGDQQRDRPVVGGGGGQQLLAPPDGPRRRRPGPGGPGPARSCGRWRRRTASPPRGGRAPRRRSRRRRRRGPPARRGRGRRGVRSSALDAASDRVWDGLAGGTAADTMRGGRRGAGLRGRATASTSSWRPLRMGQSRNRSSRWPT